MFVSASKLALYIVSISGDVMTMATKKGVDEQEESASIVSPGAATTQHNEVSCLGKPPDYSMVYLCTVR